MRILSVAGALLAGTMLAAAPALAIDVDLDAEVNADLGVDAVIGTPGGDVDADADAGVGADVGANVGGEANVGADAGGGAMISFGEGVNVAADALVGLAVHTEDDVRIGSVVSTDTAADGEALIVVELDQGYIEGVMRIAVRASAAVATEDRLTIRTTDNDLRASLAGNAGAGAGAAGNAGN